MNINGQRSGGVTLTLSGGKRVELTADQVAICDRMGTAYEDFATTLALERVAGGRATITRNDLRRAGLDAGSTGTALALSSGGVAVTLGQAGPTHMLTRDQVEICDRMGLSYEDFAETLALDKVAGGRAVITRNDRVRAGLPPKNEPQPSPRGLHRGGSVGGLSNGGAFNPADIYSGAGG